MGRKKRPTDDYEDYFGETAVAARGAPPGWPPADPVPADELAWDLTTEDGRRDLKELLDHTFYPDTEDGRRQWEAARRTLIEVIGERFGHTPKCLWTFLEYASLKRSPSLGWQAACWNEMLHRLGYAVGDELRADPGLEG